jgi:hypothetical protein
MQFVIDRRRWYRGNGSDLSALYAQYVGNKNKCCLGFLGDACGLTPNDMLGRTSPVCCSKPEVFPKSIWDGSNTPLTTVIIAVNDKPVGHAFSRAVTTEASYGRFVTEPIESEEDREARLTELFKLGGIDVTFIN